MQDKVNDIEIFSASLCGVLEEMAFIFAELIPADQLLAVKDQLFAAEMGFHGPHRGRVAVAAQHQFCTALAANMLGKDDGISDIMAGDALKELLNMACGRYLTARFGQEPVFDLSVPEIKRLKAKEWADISREAGSFVLEADEWQLVAGISLERSGILS